jgi:hypothetical protein
MSTATESVWKLASFGELDGLKKLAEEQKPLDDQDDRGL